MKEKEHDEHEQFQKLYKKIKQKIFVSTSISLLNSEVENSEQRLGDMWRFYAPFSRLKSAKGFQGVTIWIYDMTFT